MDDKKLDPRKTDSDYHGPVERAFCASESRAIAEKFMQRQLGFGFHISFLEEISLAIADEVLRMSNEIRRRRNK